MKKVKTVCSALVFTLLLIEGVLHGIHFFLHDGRRRSEEKGSQKFTILCLGNSHTAGVGAPSGQSYPDHLQRLVDHTYGLSLVKVINAGQPAANTVQVIHQLDDLLETTRPDLVILQLGGANYFNRLGIEKFNHRKYLLWQSLYRSRVFRFLHYLFYLNGRSQKGRYKPFTAFSFAESRFLSSPHYVKAMEFTIKNFIKLRLDQVDKNFYQLLLKNQGKHLREAINQFEKGIKKFPRHYQNYFYLADIYLKLQRYQESSQMIIQGLVQNSSVLLRGEINPLYYWLFYHSYHFPAAEEKKFQPYLAKYYSENTQLNFDKSEKEIAQWILQDLKVIVQNIQRRNIKILVQNYVPDPNNGRPLPGSEELKKLSSQFNLPFVDQERLFIKLLKDKNKKDFSPYYFTVRGKYDEHPNSLGYLWMAKNLLATINRQQLIKAPIVSSLSDR